MIYVALLRGINVGGKNKVEMKKLKTTFELLGFTNVITYINSGNIIFEELSKEPRVIVSEIERAIRQDFQLEIKVIVRNLENIDVLCRELPTTWVKNEMMRTDVLFLWEKVDRPQIIEMLPISSVDNVKYLSGAVLWNVECKNYRKSGMINIMGTDLYKNMTIRNVNTVRKLHQIMTTIKLQKTTNC